MRGSWARRAARSERRSARRRSMRRAYWPIIRATIAAARALHEESLAIRRELGDRKGMRRTSLNNLGNVRRSSRATMQLPGRCTRRAWRSCGNWGTGAVIAVALTTWGMWPTAQGDYPAARALHEESLAIMRELGDRSASQCVLDNLGSVAHDQGDYPAARRRCIGRAWRSERDAGRQARNCLFAGGTGGCDRCSRQLPRAPPASGARRSDCGRRSDRRCRQMTGPATTGTWPRPARRSADDAAFDRAWQEGRALTLEQAIELALDETIK